MKQHFITFMTMVLIFFCFWIFMHPVKYIDYPNLSSEEADAFRSMHQAVEALEDEIFILELRRKEYEKWCIEQWNY